MADASDFSEMESGKVIFRLAKLLEWSPPKLGTEPEAE